VVTTDGAAKVTLDDGVTAVIVAVPALAEKIGKMPIPGGPVGP
jgi:hypothetical protein